MVLPRICALVSARIYQEVGAWGVPSICPLCNTAQALLRFAKIPFEVCTANPGRFLPFVELLLSDGSVRICDGLVSLLRTLKDLRVDVDGELTTGQRAEAAAFRVIIEDADLAREWEWWVNSKNYNSVLKPVLSREYAFPLSTILPARRRRASYEKLGSSVDVQSLYRLCEETYSCLESHLDRHRYFFGDRPSSVDAVVFGYLYPVLSAPLPDARLKTLLSSYPGILRLLKLISEQYFTEDPSQGFTAPKKPPTKKQAEDPTHDQKLSPEAEEAKRKNMKFVAGILTVFFGYLLLQEGMMELVEVE